MNQSNRQFQLPFGTDRHLVSIAKTYGTPLFVHDEMSYRQHATKVLAAPNAFGLDVRYAMKANSHRVILGIFDEMGIGVDASSSFEVKRALAAGIDPDKIQLTSQEVLDPGLLKIFVESGISYNATSLYQLSQFCELFSGENRPLSIRVNPGLGSGHNNRTNTAGPSASFGIWHEYLPRVFDVIKRHQQSITSLHTHVGSGSDWTIWQKATTLTLNIARQLPDVQTVNMGGGYKIDRLRPENSIDFQQVFPYVKEAFESFENETGRRLKLEIEPGTYLAANACLLVARVMDIVDTGERGYSFIKLDASMTELQRPMMYGAIHPIRLLGTEERALKDYVVVGSCCESGDLFTPEEGDPEGIDPIRLPEASIGDYVAVLSAGAYGITLAAKNYNSRPICAEAIIRADSTDQLITRRQDPEDIWRRELTLD